MTDDRERLDNSIELLDYSLKNAFGILRDVACDVTQEQADWQPPGLANPIGATYWHTLSSCDYVVHQWGRGEPPLSEREGWRDRALSVSLPEPEHGGDWHGWMRAIRVDLPALHEYARAVELATAIWLGSLAPEDLARGIETPVGELNLGQMLETFVIWHLNAHCGEIAALKGCQGARGYPF
jgi:hypothetical protein